MSPYVCSEAPQTRGKHRGSAFQRVRNLAHWFAIARGEAVHSKFLPLKFSDILAAPESVEDIDKPSQIDLDL